MTSAEAVRIAQRMYGDGDNGWTMAAIHRYLRAHGIDCTVKTVNRWCRPDWHEAELVRIRDYKRRVRAGVEPPGGTPIPPWAATTEGRMARARALRAAGLTPNDIARVMALDLREPVIGRGVIGRAVNHGITPRAWRSLDRQTAIAA